MEKEDSEQIRQVSIGIEETIKTTCDLINSRIRNKRPSYSATPERITGLLHIIRSAIHLYDTRHPAPELDDTDDDCTLPGNYLTNYFNKMGLLNPELKLGRVNPRGLALMLLPYFKQANDCVMKEFRAKDDEEFRNVVQLHLQVGYSCVKDEIPDALKTDIDKWFRYIIHYISNADFKSGLSLEGHQDRIQRCAVEHIEDENIRDLAKQMENALREFEDKNGKRI